MAKREQTDEEIRADIAKLRARIKEQKRLLEIDKAKTARMQAEYDEMISRPRPSSLEILKRALRGEVSA